MMAEAMDLMDAWLRQPTEVLRQRMRELLGRMRAEQNEQQSIPSSILNQIWSAGIVQSLADTDAAGSSATLFLEGTPDVVARLIAFVRDPQGVVTRGADLRPDARAVRGSGALSSRETEVLGLIAAGESNGQIAARLGISINTVERHVVNVYRKIDARGRAEATAWAIRNGVA